MCYINLMFLFLHFISYLMDVLYWNTRVSHDYKDYNDYRDSDLDLDWERFSDLVTTLLSIDFHQPLPRFFGMLLN